MTLLLLVFLCFRAAAVENPPVSLEAQSSARPVQYFGGQQYAIPLRLVSSRDASYKVRFGLMQLAADLSAPLSPVVPFADDLVIRADVPRSIVATVSLPAVKSKILAVLQVEVCEKDGSIWLSAGRLFLLIHPEEAAVTRVLQKSASDLAARGVSFAVVWGDPFFSDLFSGLGIIHGILDSAPRDRAVIYFGRTTDWDLPPSATRGKTIVRIMSDMRHPEGLHIVRTSEGFDARINQYDANPLSKPVAWDLLAGIFSELNQIVRIQTKEATP